MIEKLEITHLRTLAAVFKCGNTSAAAEYLDVSQQAISQQLKKIRGILGDRLFVRTGHGMAPTPYARLIEPHIHKILTQLNEIPLPDALTPSQLTRTLVISATDYTQRVIVSGLIHELRHSAPNVRVIVINIESVNLVRKMQQGEIDLAFTSAGYVPEGLVSDALFIEQYRCVSANTALLAEGTLSLDRLAQLDFVITSPGTGSFRGSADTWFEQHGLHRTVAVSAPSFYMAQETLKNSDLVGFLPARLLPCQGLHDLPLEKYPPGYEVVAAYHPSVGDDAFITWLLTTVKKQLS